MSLLVKIVATNSCDWRETHCLVPCGGLFDYLLVWLVQEGPDVILAATLGHELPVFAGIAALRKRLLFFVWL